MALISWTVEALNAEIETQGQSILDRIAIEIGETAMPPIDTGFLKNSVYTQPEGYGDPWPTGQYVDRTGNLVPRVGTAQVQPSAELEAIVGWAAEHAVWIEETQPYIYISVLTVAGNYSEGV